MAYQVVLARENIAVETHDESIKLTPRDFISEFLALEYTFGLLEGYRKHKEKRELLFQIHGPEGFIMENKVIIEKYRKWYWMKTGRLP